MLILLGFTRSAKGKFCQYNTVNVLKEFRPSSGAIAEAIKSRDECEEYCSTQESCWGCSVHCASPCQWNAIPACGLNNDWMGLIDGDITQKPGKRRCIIEVMYSFIIKLIPLCIYRCN